MADLTRLRELFMRAMVNAWYNSMTPAEVGRPNEDGTYTIDVDESSGKIYATRSTDLTVVEALNTGVPKIAKYPILLQTTPDGQTRAVEPDSLRAAEFSGTAAQATAGPHGHYRGSGLVDYVEGERIIPTNVTVNGDGTELKVYIWPFFYLYQGTEKYWPGGSYDVTSFVPGTANTWGWVKIGINPSTNTAIGVAGDTFGVTLPLAKTYLTSIDFVTPGYIPCGAVKLRNGQTAINNWRDFADVTRWGTGMDASIMHDHSVYFLLAGRAGGQTAVGGTASGEDLTLQSTAHATKGSIVLDDSIKVKASSTLTLSTDAATVTGPYHLIAAETGVTDDLATLTAHADRTLVLLQADTGDTITVKHGTGNINLNGGADFELSGDKTLLLFYDGTNWADIGAGGGGGASPLTTKGDLYTYDTGDQRLAVGTDGQVLTADSAQATGIKWAAAAAGSGGSLTKTTKTLETRTRLYQETLSGSGNFDTTGTDLSGYDHLLVRVKVRSVVAATNDVAKLFYNNDQTSANYSAILGYMGTSTGSARYDIPYIAYITGDSSPTDYFATFEVLIEDYEGDDYKSAFALYEHRRDATTHYTGPSSHHWESTSAITRIQLQSTNGASGNFIAGSSIEVIGIKEETVVTDVSGGRGSIGVQTDDVTVANTVTETTLLGTFSGTDTLEADLLAAGKSVRVTLRGYLSSKASTAGTLTIKATLGGTEICSTGAITVTDNLSSAIFEVQVLLTCRTAGATGTVVAGGLSVLGDQDAGMVKASTTTVDTTGTLAVDLTATWGTADAGNTVTAQQVLIEELN